MPHLGRQGYIGRLDRSIGYAGRAAVLLTASGVVVVADHFWQAKKARDALRIGWDPGPNQGSTMRQMWSLLNQARRQCRRLGAGSDDVCRRTQERQRVDALKKAAKTFSAVYELPLVAHATMEPMNCTADVKADRCDVYVGTQVQQLAQSGRGRGGGIEARPGQRPYHLARRRVRPPPGGGLRARRRSRRRKRSARR